METLLILVLVVLLLLSWFKPNFDYIIDLYNDTWLIMWYSPTPFSTTRKYITLWRAKGNS